MYVKFENLLLKVNAEEYKMYLKSQTIIALIGRRTEIAFSDLSINLKFHQYLIYLRKYYHFHNQSHNQLNLQL